MEGFDPAVLAGLRGLQRPGEPDPIAELIELYRAMLPGYLADMDKALAESTPSLLEHVAHKLRGSSASLGAVGIESLCRELEQRGRNGSLQGTEDIIGRLKIEAQRIMHSAKSV